MLSHGDACRGAEDGHGGGDVERIQSIAASSADVKDDAGASGVAQRHSRSTRAQFACERSQLIGGLAFLRERGEEIRLGLGRNGFGSHVGHGVGHLFGRQIRTGTERFGQRIQHAERVKVLEAPFKVFWEAVS